MQAIVVTGRWGNPKEDTFWKLPSDLLRITTIYITAGDCINSIRFTYEDINHVPETTPKYGGDAGTEHRVSSGYIYLLCTKSISSYSTKPHNIYDGYIWMIRLSLLKMSKSSRLAEHSETMTTVVSWLRPCVLLLTEEAMAHSAGLVGLISHCRWNGVSFSDSMELMGSTSNPLVPFLNPTAFNQQRWWPTFYRTAGMVEVRGINCFFK